MDADRPLIEDDLLILAADLINAPRMGKADAPYVVISDGQANLIAGQLLRAAAMLRPPQTNEARLAAKYPIR